MQNEKNILYGGPIMENITEDSQSLGEYCLKKLRDKGEHIVLIDGLTHEIYTASHLLSKCIRLAECLRHYGIKPGDKIGLLGENCTEFLCILYATFFVGACVAPINSSYTEREIAHAFNLSRPKIVFSSEASLKVTISAVANCPYVEKVIVFGKSIDNILKSNNKFQSPINNLLSYYDFINNHQVKSTQTFLCSKTDMNNNISIIVCSSGTTGLPKGVQLTDYNIIVTLSQAMDRMQTLDVLKITIGVLPWFHVYGLFTTLAIAFVHDAEIIVLPKFNDHLFLQTIQRYKSNYLLLVPPLMVFLAKSPLVDQYDLSSLLLVSSGAAPLGKEIEQYIRDRLKVPIVQQAYGMSEATLTTLGQSLEFCKPGSNGTLRPGLWGKVINPDTGESLSAYEQGELLFKGDVIMKGYIGDTTATKSTIDKDGWLHSGDIGYYDKDGEWFIVDRFKELIKYKGYQVPPAELEAILLTNPKIKDAAVIGIPDDEAGELPMAFVVKSIDCEISAQEVMDFVAEKVSSAKRLRGGVMFMNEIPKNLSGKILRRELRDMVKNKKSKL